MKTTTFKWIIGAVIVMFIFAGTAWADGKRGGQRQDNGKSYHSTHSNDRGAHFNQGRSGRKFGRYQHRPKHPQPRFQQRPNYRKAPRRDYRPHRPPVRPHYSHRSHDRRADAFYGFSFSILDPYFALGFSTGGRW